MEGKQFRKAVKLYRHRKYTKVIQILEPQVFRFRESFTFFYLLGMSCLHVGDIGGAYSYLNRAHDLNEKEVNTLLGLAVVYLRKHDTQKALSTWFLVLDVDPGNKTAQRGLNFLKKYSETEDLHLLYDDPKLQKIMPSFKFIQHSFRKVLVFLIIAAVVGGALYVTYSKLLIKKEVSVRKGVEILELNASVKANSKVDEKYRLTEKELKKLLADIRDNFNHFEDNSARLKINKILLSNADIKIKNQVKLLRGYLEDPSFATLKTNYSYRDFLKEPLLYENCYVIWKGMVSNLVVTENSITFDLLVGYENGKILDGIVPVILDFGVKIDTALPVEVLGKITFKNSKLFLQGISIHQFVKDQQ